MFSMRLVAAVIACALSVTFPALTNAGGPRNARSAGTCPAFADFNWKKLGAAWNERIVWSAEDEQNALARHKGIRGPIPLPDLSRAEVTLSLTVGAGHTQEYPTETSSFVWKEAGKWQIDRVDHGRTWHVSPEPPGSRIKMDEAWHEKQRRNHHQGPLAALKAAEIEQALTDPCLASQSDSPPMQIPTKKGPGEPCWGGTGTTILIRRGTDTRIISDYCGRWAAGRLMSAVMYGQVDPEFSVRQSIRDSRSGVRSIKKMWWGKHGYPYMHAVCGVAEGDDGRNRRFVYRTNEHGGKWRTQLTVETNGKSDEDLDYDWLRFNCAASRGQG